MSIFSRLFLGDDATVAAVELIEATIAEYPEQWSMEFCRLRHCSGKLMICLPNDFYDDDDVDRLFIEVDGLGIRPRWLLRRRLNAICQRYVAMNARKELHHSLDRLRDNVVAIKDRAA